MEYKVEFGLYDYHGNPIPIEVRNELIDKWVKAVDEKRILWTGGGIREYTLADLIVDKLWLLLWKVKWLRREA